jgi:hypothetical protein
MVPRAPIDLRVNGARATVEEVIAELREAGLSPERTPWSAWGLRLSAEPPPNVQALEAFKAGRIEIQDEGSQIVCWLAGVEPGMTVVDYCAGGGGKTLGLAMQGLADGASRVEAAPPEPERIWTPTGWVDAPKSKPGAATIARAEGRLIACDVVQKRLDNIRPRLARAGVEAELIHLGPNGGGPDVATPMDRRCSPTIRPARAVPMESGVKGWPFDFSAWAPAFRQRSASGISAVTTMSPGPARSAIQSSAMSGPASTTTCSIQAVRGVWIQLLETTRTVRL